MARQMNEHKISQTFSASGGSRLSRLGAERVDTY